MSFSCCKQRYECVPGPSKCARHVPHVRNVWRRLSGKTRRACCKLGISITVPEVNSIVVDGVAWKFREYLVNDGVNTSASLCQCLRDFLVSSDVLSQRARARKALASMSSGKDFPISSSKSMYSSSDFSYQAAVVQAKFFPSWKRLTNRKFFFL